MIEMARRAARQTAKVAKCDDTANARPFPFIALPDPPSVEPIAVACAAVAEEEEDDDNLGVTFPVDVAIAEPASKGKFPPIEDERMYCVAMICGLERETSVSGGVEAVKKGVDGGEILDDVAAAAATGLVAFD